MKFTSHLPVFFFSDALVPLAYGLGALVLWPCRAKPVAPLGRNGGNRILVKDMESSLHGKNHIDYALQSGSKKTSTTLDGRPQPSFSLGASRSALDSSGASFKPLARGREAQWPVLGSFCFSISWGSPSRAIGGPFALAAHPEHMVTEATLSPAGLVQKALVTHLGARGEIKGPRGRWPGPLLLCCPAPKQ